MAQFLSWLLSSLHDLAVFQLDLNAFSSVCDLSDTLTQELPLQFLHERMVPEELLELRRLLFLRPNGVEPVFCQPKRHIPGPLAIYR